MMEENLISKTYDSGFVANIILKPGFASKFMGIVVDFGAVIHKKLVVVLTFWSISFLLKNTVI